MRKLLIILIFGCSKVFSQSQPWFNFVSNYSFEIMQNGGFDAIYQGTGFGNHNSYNGPNGIGIYGTDNTWKFTSDYFGQVFEWTSPIKKAICLGWVGVATADIATNETDCPNTLDCSRTGNNVGHADGDEWLVVPLRQPLQPGKRYMLECFFEGDHKTTWKVIFSENQPKQCDYGPLSGLGAKDVFNPENQFSLYGPSGYMKAGFNFIVNGERDWMTFGSHGVKVDDIRIYEVPDNGCLDVWYFDNTDFSYQTEFYQAGDKIICGAGVDPENGVNHIAGPVYACTGVNTILKAGNAVILEPGFETRPNTYFETVIEPCSNNPCPEVPDFPDFELCSQDPIQILGTGGSNYGISYSWSPSNDLDNENSAQPIFVPPTANGHEVLTVSMNIACANGESFYTSQDVSVHWSDGNMDPIGFNFTINSVNISDHHYELDMNFGLGTTSILVEMISDNGVVDSQEYYRGVDYSGTSFNWVNPFETDQCDDQHLTFTATNFCSGEEIVINGLWDKPEECERLLSQGFTINEPAPNVVYNPVPHVFFSPDNDAVDEFFYIIDSQNPTCMFNADKWQLLVYDQNENTPYFERVVDRTGECCPFGNTSVINALDNGFNVTRPLLDAYHIPYWDGSRENDGDLDYNTGDTKSWLFRVWKECDGQLYSQVWGGVVYHNGDGSQLVADERDPSLNLVGPLDFGKGKTDQEVLDELSDFLKIYPNPTNSNVKIYSGKDINFINILDAKGSIIKVVESGVHEISTSFWESGIYIFEVNYSDGTVERRKVIKQ